MAETGSQRADFVTWKMSKTVKGWGRIRAPAFEYSD
jgi:hypothetical protein